MNFRITTLTLLSTWCRGEKEAEGAGDFSPLNKRENRAGLSPGPEGQFNSCLDFVELKPQVPSVNTARISSVPLRDMHYTPQSLSDCNDLFGGVVHDSSVAGSGCDGVERDLQLIQLEAIERLDGIFIPAPGAQIGQVKLSHVPRGLFQNQTPALPNLPAASGKTCIQNRSYVERLTMVLLHLGEQFVVTAQCGVSGLDPFRFVNEQHRFRRCNPRPSL